MQIRDDVIRGQNSKDHEVWFQVKIQGFRYEIASFIKTNTPMGPRDEIDLRSTHGATNSRRVVVGLSVGRSPVTTPASRRRQVLSTADHPLSL